MTGVEWTEVRDAAEYATQNRRVPPPPEKTTTPKMTTTLPWTNPGLEVENCSSTPIFTITTKSWGTS